LRAWLAAALYCFVMLVMCIPSWCPGRRYVNYSTQLQTIVTSKRSRRRPLITRDWIAHPLPVVVDAQPVKGAGRHWIPVPQWSPRCLRRNDACGSAICAETGVFARQGMMASTVFFSALGWAGDLGAFSRACSSLAPSSWSCLRPRPARTLGNQSCSSSSM
jgi:hypothetical protein